MLAGCSSGVIDGQLPNESNPLVLSETSVLTQRDSLELAKLNFQQKVSDELMPDLETISEVLRKNQIYGKVLEPLYEVEPLVEDKVCEGFTLDRLLSAGSRARRSSVSVFQDILPLELDEIPDIVYDFEFVSVVDADIDQLMSTLTEISDVFFLSPDKRCTGELVTGLVLEDMDLREDTEFVTGFFPEVSTQNEEIVHFVQSADVARGFARAYSLFVFKPADVVLALVVLGDVNAKRTTSDVVLEEVGRVSRAIREVWLSKVRTDSSWLELTK